MKDSGQETTAESAASTRDAESDADRETEAAGAVATHSAAVPGAPSRSAPPGTVGHDHGTIEPAPEGSTFDGAAGGATSVQREAKAGGVSGSETPDIVKEVVSSGGQPLDPSVQQAMEEKMGDSLGDVRIHTGPKAAKACEAIGARAFTVGNHIVFNAGEYDPTSEKGQHLLAHELAHVRQQTGGAVSMLPQEGGLQIDPDPALERDAEQTAQRVMQGETLGIQRLAKTDVHVQRYPGHERVETAREQAATEEKAGVPADTEALAEEVEQIKDRQEQMMAALSEAEPGAPTDGEWGKAATKGVVGSAAGAVAGATAGSVIPGVGTAVGAATGAAVAGATSDVAKEGVDFMSENRPGGEGEKIEQMYHEISEMYEDLKEGEETGTSRFSEE